MAQDDPGLDDLLDAELSVSNTRKFNVKKEALDTAAYLKLVQNRLDQVEWNKRKNIFSLNLGKIYGDTDTKLTGSEFSSGSTETLKYLLINSYSFEEKQKLDTLYWSRCSSKVNRLLRTISGYFFNKERAYHHKRSKDLKAYEKYMKYHPEAKERKSVNRDLEAMKSGCRAEMIKPVLLFIRDVNKFSKDAFQSRQKRQEPVFVKLDKKRQQWIDEWSRRDRTIRASVITLFQDLQQTYPKQFMPWKPTQITETVSDTVKETKASPSNKEKCYLLVSESGNYSIRSISEFAIPLISQSITLVHPVPLYGIKTDDCVYRVSILESRQKITATIGSETFNATGETREAGLEGVKAALVNAVVSANPSATKSICDNFRDIAGSVCDDSKSSVAGQTVFKESPLISILKSIQVYPRVTRFEQINTNGNYKLITRGKRTQATFFEANKAYFFPDESKVIFYHQDRHLISFPEKKGLAQSVHFIMGYKTNPALEHAGFTEKGGPEQYSKLFVEYGLVGFKLEQMLSEQHYANYQMYVSLTAQTPSQPSLRVVVKFKKRWNKLESTMKHVAKKDEFYFRESKLVPEEVIFY
ncbi:MAG: hypothetical protein MJE63_01970 [Proteobacteria bacterium]|nr:hypothetical protein [Pseudomonadota bacterium]